MEEDLQEVVKGLFGSDGPSSNKLRMDCRGVSRLGPETRTGCVMDRVFPVSTHDWSYGRGPIPVPVGSEKGFVSPVTQVPRSTGSTSRSDGSDTRTGTNPFTEVVRLYKS